MTEPSLHRTTARILVAIGLLVALGSCADAEPLTVTEAVSASGNQSVVGSLLVQDDTVRLCEALAESFPPQCGGDSILVTGLDLSTVSGLQTEQSISWTDEPVTLIGVLESGVLDVD